MAYCAKTGNEDQINQNRKEKTLPSPLKLKKVIYSWNRQRFKCYTFNVEVRAKSEKQMNKLQPQGD